MAGIELQNQMSLPTIHSDLTGKVVLITEAREELGRDGGGVWGQWVVSRRRRA